MFADAASWQACYTDTSCCHWNMFSINSTFRFSILRCVDCGKTLCLSSWTPKQICFKTLILQIIKIGMNVVVLLDSAWGFGIDGNSKTGKRKMDCRQLCFHFLTRSYWMFTIAFPLTVNNHRNHPCNWTASQFKLDVIFVRLQTTIAESCRSCWQLKKSNAVFQTRHSVEHLSPPRPNRRL